MIQRYISFLLGLLMPIPVVGLDKIRPPDRERQLGAEQKLKEAFGRALPRTPEEKVKRAKELLEEAGRALTDADYRYVLCQTALSTAAEAGGIEIAVEARKILAADYDVNEMVLNKDLWSKVPVHMADKRRQAAIELSELCLMSLERQLTDGWLDSDSVQEILQECQLYFNRANNDWLQQDLQDIEQELDFRSKEQKSYLQAAKKLESDPSDPVANSTCGRFLCLCSNKWKEGLPLLKKGSDRSFRACAEAEIDQSADLNKQLQLAEAELKLAEGTKGRWKIGLCQRARYWCEQVLREARGDRRTKTEELLKRIDGEQKELPTREGRLWEYFSQFAGDLKVISAGFDCGNMVRISFKGKDLVNRKGLPDFEQARGIHVVIFQRGQIKAVSHFDTCASEKNSQDFANAIAAVHRGGMVVIAVCDEAVSNFTESAQQAIESIGGRIGLYKQKYRCSYFCIGLEGMASGQAIEKLEPNMKLEFPSKS